MRKIKSFIFALLAALAATCCFALVACDGNIDLPVGKADEYTVVWTVGEHATVTATGYDALPQKLAKGTEVTFSVDMDEGWQLVSVTGVPDNVVKNDDTYKFTVNGNISIVVLTIQCVIPDCAITWDIDEHATVTATSYDTLPELLTVGTPVVFSVDVDEGWEIDSVGPASVVTKIGEYYSFTVANNVTITVTTKEVGEIPPQPPQPDVTMYEITEITCESENSTLTVVDCTMPVTYTYFVIKGKFVDGESLYAKFVGSQYDSDVVVSQTVTRAAGSDAFELRFNTFELVRRLGYGLDVVSSGMDAVAAVCYVDIYATDGEGNETTERLKGPDYESVITNIDDEITYGVLNYWYEVEIATNGGIDKDCIKLVLWKSMRNNYIIEASLGEEGGKPYVVFSGNYYLSYDRDEALEKIENFVYDIAVFNDWENTADFTQTATLNDDFTFTVKVSLDKLRADKVYIMHASVKYKETLDDTNLHYVGMGMGSVLVGDKFYQLILHDTGWGWYWPAISVTTEQDPDKSLTVTGTTVKVVDGKPYYTVTYYYAGYTQAEIEALPVNFDLQCNDNINGGGWTRNFFDDKISFVIDAENNTFDVRIDISSLRALHGYTVQFSLDKDEGERVDGVNNPADFKPNISGVDGVSVACGDITYTFMYKKGSGDKYEYWGCVGLLIANTPGYALAVNKTVQLAVEDGKAYVVISGTYDGYTLDELKARITVDYQNPDNSWATTVFTAQQLVITTDAEAKTFTVKADVTNVPNGQYLLHFNGDDIGNESGIAAKTCGDKTYAYVNRDFGGWTRYVLTIADASAE